MTEVLTLLGTALLFLLCALLGSLWGFTLAWGPQALREASEISRRGRKIRSRHRRTDAERDGLIHERHGSRILRSSSSELAAGYTKIGLLVDAPNTGCSLPWRILRTVVLPILPGGPFYVCKVVLLFVRKQPLIPVRRIAPSFPGLVVQGSTEVRRHGVLGSSAHKKRGAGPGLWHFALR